MSEYQLRVVRHTLVVLFLGLVGGFVFTYDLLQQIVLPPLPLAFDFDAPGEPSAWRAVHLGTLMNAIMALALTPLLSFTKTSPKTQSRLSWALVTTIWGNAIFYTFAVFAPNRGLTLGENQFGTGNWAGFVAASAAVVAAYALIAFVVVLFFSLAKAEKAD